MQPSPTLENDRQDEPRTSLFLIDERIFVLETLCAKFAAHREFEIVGATSHAEHALKQIDLRKPAILLIDVAVARSCGFSLAERIAKMHPGGKLVFLDDWVQRDHLAAALRLNCHGYFLRVQSFQTLARGLFRIAAGRRAFAAAIQFDIEAAADQSHDQPEQPAKTRPNLTPRETDVLRQLVGGASVKQCAEQLGISPSTVDNHKSRLMKKLGVHKATELVAMAVRSGLV